MNSTQQMGRLTRDPELRYTPQGKAVVGFSIAVNSGGNGQDEADFFECVAWEKQAELIANSCKKGHRIVLWGRLKLEKWTDQQSQQQRSVVKIIVSGFNFVEPPPQSQQPTQNTQPPAAGPPPYQGQQPGYPPQQFPPQGYPQQPGYQPPPYGAPPAGTPGYVPPGQGAYPPPGYPQQPPQGQPPGYGAPPPGQYQGQPPQGQRPIGFRNEQAPGAPGGKYNYIIDDDLPF